MSKVTKITERRGSSISGWKVRRFWTHLYKYAGETVHQAGGKSGLKLRVEVWVGERSGSHPEWGKTKDGLDAEGENVQRWAMWRNEPCAATLERMEKGTRNRWHCVLRRRDSQGQRPERSRRMGSKNLGGLGRKRPLFTADLVAKGRGGNKRGGNKPFLEKVHLLKADGKWILG